MAGWPTIPIFGPICQETFWNARSENRALQKVHRKVITFFSDVRMSNVSAIVQVRVDQAARPTPENGIVRIQRITHRVGIHDEVHHI